MARKPVAPAPSVSSNTTWEAAESSAKSSNRKATLSALLELWREIRDPALAAAIDALSNEINRGKSLYPVGASREERILAWDNLAKSPDDAETGLLAAALVDGVRAGDTSDRIDRFSALKPDPRIASAYQRMISSPPWTASSNGKIWTAMLDQATGTHADPRTSALIRAIEARYLDIFGRSVMGEKMKNAIGRAAKSLESQFSVRSATLDATSRSRLDALVESLKLQPFSGIASLPLAPSAAPPVLPPSKGGKLDSSDAFLSHIAEAPDDDSRIEEFAAWLTRKGDPRAEFMDIQLRKHRGLKISHADEKREITLLKKHQKDWLGPIAGAVPGAPQGFERGVLTECAITLKGKHTALAVGHPGWATVRKAACHWGKDLSFLLGHPIFRSLREVSSVPSPLFHFLCKGTFARSIEKLEVPWGPHPDDIDARFSAPDLPQLRDLTIGTDELMRANGVFDDEAGPERYLPFLSSPLFAQLTRFRMEVAYQHMKWIELLQKQISPTHTITVEVGPFVLTREAGGALTRISTHLAATYVRDFAYKIKDLAPERFTHVEIAIEGKLDGVESEWTKALKDEVARFRNAGVTVVAPEIDAV